MWFRVIAYWLIGKWSDWNYMGIWCRCPECKAHRIWWKEFTSNKLKVPL